MVVENSGDRPKEADTKYAKSQKYITPKENRKNKMLL
jgi:hypothetical protein